MGAEAYGLVGFSIMLQAWFGLLDLGLTPTISRESARFRAGVLTELDYRRIFRALSIAFYIIGTIGGLLLLIILNSFANSWLNANTLSKSDITFAINIMAVSVVLRWICGLYKGVIVGAEKLVLVSFVTVIIAVFRFVAVLLSMSIYGYTIKVFFIHQLIVSIAEYLILYKVANRILPSLPEGFDQIGWSLKPLSSVLKFSLTVAFTSSVWVLVTQSDKLVLSGILELSEYGYFTLAVLIAGGISIIGGAAGNAIMPRLANIYAQESSSELIFVYRKSTRYVSVLAGSAGITIVMFAKPLLSAWTGDYNLAVFSAPILQLYAIGNVIMAVSAFPYYLQYAQGNLKYHLYGNIVSSLIMVPFIIFAAYKFGAQGTGWIWVLLNGIYFFTWLGYVHSKIAPGIHVNWVCKDVFGVLLPSTVVMYCISNEFQIHLNERWEVFAYIVLMGFIALLISALTSFLISKEQSCISVKL